MENTDKAVKQEEIRRSGRLALDRILEWDRGDREVAVAKVILADASDSFQEPS